MTGTPRQVSSNSATCRSPRRCCGKPCGCIHRSSCCRAGMFGHSSSSTTTFRRTVKFFISPQMCHRDPTLFERPESFRPDRFLVQGPESQVDPFSFIPFGKGSHMCMGMNFATLAVKAFFAQLLRAFDIRLAAERTPDIGYLPTLRPAERLPLRFVPNAQIKRVAIGASSVVQPRIALAAAVLRRSLRPQPISDRDRAFQIWRYSAGDQHPVTLQRTPECAPVGGNLRSDRLWRYRRLG